MVFSRYKRLSLFGIVSMGALQDMPMSSRRSADLRINQKNITFTISVTPIVTIPNFKCLFFFFSPWIIKSLFV